MFINNEKVQGLYIYSENIEYTKGDLVVSGECIYICNAEKISGIDPADDIHNDYYHPYPGPMIKTASEFLQYIKEDGVEDRYVSGKAIMEILQCYQFGYNMEGVIEDYIDKNGDTTLILSSISDRPLDNLMLTESLNRGKVRVSRELSQISNGEMVLGDGELVPYSTTVGSLVGADSNGEDIDYYLILTQYTYKQSEGAYIRIQELMSPLTGVTVYRFMYWEEGYFPSDNNVISSWREVYSYSSSICSKLYYLNTYYNTLAEQLEDRVASLTNSFRFKEVYSGSGDIVSGLGEGVYTVCLEGTVAVGENTYNKYTESVTVRLTSRMTNYSIYFTKLKGYLALSSGSIELHQENQSQENQEESTQIISVYSRETYSNNNQGE